MSLPLPLDPGTSIGGQYIVGALINSGGFGAVYRGTDTSEGDRPCAIKETYDVSPAARRRALTEASVLFTVSSKNLPRVYDAFEANGRFYLVMQLIEGQNLQQLLKKRVNANGQPFTEQQVLAWLLPIMQVLQELHSRNPAVIHRDIKPSNIILTPEHVAVLVDFGLTRLYDPARSGQTGPTRAISEGFSPIEQYLGQTTPQSDIYAMAATIYMLLTNIIPPSSLTRGMHDTLQAPCSCNPAISPHVEQALLKALAVQPEDRYYSMADFARALQQNTFTAYSDPTIAEPIPPPPPPPPPPSARPANPTGTPSAPFVVPAKTNQNQWGNGYRPQQPTPARPASAPYSTRGTVPPGYVLVPQTALVPPKPLPGAVSQGCLWGLLQGVLSALIVLFLKKEADFYLAIGIAFLFYLLTGFLTTRRGGSAMRGALAGFWAGITGTTVFWITLFSGAIILVASRINADTLVARQQGNIPPPDEVQRAWRAVLPIFSPHRVSQSQSSTQSAIVVFLVAGILVAVAFGLLGGLLGRLFHRSMLRRKVKMVLKSP
jgi:serine/threonine protein kinase